MQGRCTLENIKYESFLHTLCYAGCRGRRVESLSSNPCSACIVPTFSNLSFCLESGIVLEKVCEYFAYNEKNQSLRDVPDMDIPPELCLELLMAADYLDSKPFSTVIHLDRFEIDFGISTA